MANGFIVVDEKDWEKTPADRRDWLIFNTLKSMDERLKKLERRPFYDKACAAVGGIIGGAIAAVGIKWGS